MKTTSKFYQKLIYRLQNLPRTTHIHNIWTWPVCARLRNYTLRDNYWRLQTHTPVLKTASTTLLQKWNVRWRQVRRIPTANEHMKTPAMTYQRLGCFLAWSWLVRRLRRTLLDSTLTQFAHGVAQPASTETVQRENTFTLFTIYHLYTNTVLVRSGRVCFASGRAAACAVSNIAYSEGSQKRKKNNKC